MSKTIKIPGRIESVATGKVVTGANFILDDTKGKKQNVINEETDAELLRLDQEKQGNLTFDQAPTEDSTNPVTSGGVYAAEQVLSQAIEAILLLIPSAASELNKLVDLATMNRSISTATASFKGTYNLVSDLHLTVSATHAQIAAALDALSLGADNNDYAFVQVPNTDTAPTDIAKTERYKFNGENWAYEYDLNNSGFTTAQWNAINSGITTLLVAKLSALPTNEALTLALAGKQDNLTFDNAPTAGSNNPVKSGGIYTRNNEIVALINALDAAKQNVLTFDTTPTNGSTNPVTSNGVYLAIQLVQTAVVALDGRMSTAEGNIVNLQAAYAALTQSDIVVVSGALPSSGQQQNIIYRQPDQDHTPPQFYSDYMWNGTTWVLMATYNNAIDQRPKKGSQNLVTSGGVFDNMGALDVSELNATENPHTHKPYATLDAALADIPSDYQKGGMSIKFVQSSDNNYVKFFCTADEFTTDVTKWQGVDDEPIAGSDNLVKSGGAYNMIQGLINGYIDTDWVQGTVADGTISGYPAGTVIEMGPRISSLDNNVGAGNKLHYVITNGYSLALESWDDNSEQITDKSGWLTGEGDWVPQYDKVYLIIKKNDESNLTPDAGNKAKIYSYNGITEQVDVINKTLNGGTYSLIWQSGGVENGNNPGYPAGSIVENPARICSINNNIGANHVIHYAINSGYSAGFKSWDGVSELITDYTTWKTGEGEWTPKYDKVYIILKKNDDSNISPSVGSNLSITLDGVAQNVNNLMNVKSNYYQKKVVTYGDSITEMNIWQPHLSEEYGCTIVNLGIGGTRVAKYDYTGYAYNNSFSDDTRIASIPTDADYILIMGGANDFGSPAPALPMGEPIWDTQNGVFLETNFVSAYCEVIRKIQTRCPNARIIIMSWCGGQYTSPNFPCHVVKVKSAAPEAGTLSIELNGVTKSISLTQGQSVSSILYHLAQLTFDNFTVFVYNDAVYFNDHNDTSSGKSFEVSGVTSMIETETLKSMPQRINQIGFTPKDYRDGAEKAALLNNVYFIDLWKCGFNVYNRSLYIQDSVHPNSLGGKIMADYIIGRMNEINIIL